MALLGVVSALVKVSARMRMNYNFHQSLEERFLNAVEPGTVVPIHRHVAKDECFVVLRGKVRVTAVIGDVVLSRESGCYGGGHF